VERAADGQDGATLEGEDRAGRHSGRLDPARLGLSREPFQVLNDPAVQDDQLVEDDETTFDEPPPERDPAMPALPDGVAEDDTGRILPSRRTSMTGTGEASCSRRDRDAGGAADAGVPEPPVP
jgi:hypothetical protein